MNGSPIDLSRTGLARGLAGVREALDELRPNAARRPGPAPSGGDVREAVLGVLAEQAADGYRIVRLLAERGGARTPGAGEVYPTLQLLADEGLVAAADEEGRNVWSLTTAGRAAAEAARYRHDDAAPTTQGVSGHRRSIVRAAAQLGQAAALAAQIVPSHRVAEVTAVLDDARRRILSILARD